LPAPSNSLAATAPPVHVFDKKPGNYSARGNDPKSATLETAGQQIAPQQQQRTEQEAAHIETSGLVGLLFGKESRT